MNCSLKEHAKPVLIPFRMSSIWGLNKNRCVVYAWRLPGLAGALTWKRPVSCSGEPMPLVCPGIGGSGLEWQKETKIWKRKKMTVEHIMNVCEVNINIFFTKWVCNFFSFHVCIQHVAYCVSMNSKESYRRLKTIRLIFSYSSKNAEINI